MRPPERIPLVLAALERRWDEMPDLTFGQFIYALFEPTGWTTPPLVGLTDHDLLALLGSDGSTDQTPERRQSIVCAISDRWRQDPDLRLGQLLTNAFVKRYFLNPTDAQWFSLMEDGVFLWFFQPLTPEEERYVEEEPAARRRAFREAFGETHRR